MIGTWADTDYNTRAYRWDEGASSEDLPRPEGLSRAYPLGIGQDERWVAGAAVLEADTTMASAIVWDIDATPHEVGAELAEAGIDLDDTVLQQGNGFARPAGSRFSRKLPE